MCPPSCVPLPSYTFDVMKMRDQCNPDVHSWMDDPISMEELRLALDNSKIRSAPGLDRIDFRIFRHLPHVCLTHLLGLFNRVLNSGVFPVDWKQSLIVFIPKSDGLNVRPISITSCILRTMERILYYRLKWYLEVNRIIPDIQFGFRSSKSCIDNVVILCNNIHSAFINSYTIGVFLDISGAFDNIIPSILIKELELIGLPAKLRRFYENLIFFRDIYMVKEGNINETPDKSCKGTPQGSATSPILFNIYLRSIQKCVLKGVQMLQYADDLVVFVSGRDLDQIVHLLQTSICRINNYFNDLGLELAPSKSQYIIFHRKKSPGVPSDNLNVDGINIPRSYSVRFLGITLDERLSGRFHLENVIRRGRGIISIIASLASTKWGAHPSLLLNIYRSVFRGIIEYGSQIFKLKGNKSKFLILQRLQYAAIRKALGYRNSTPINILLHEAKEFPILIRFKYINLKYIYKSFSINNNPVVNSINKINFNSNSRIKIIKAHKNIPLFSFFVVHKYISKIINKTSFLSAFFYGFKAYIFRPDYVNLNLPIVAETSAVEANQMFLSAIREFSNDATLFYTDGSKLSMDDPAGVGIYSPTLNIKVCLKLTVDTSVYSAEAWAILQVLFIILRRNLFNSVIFSDSKSVLDAIYSCNIDHRNYLISFIKYKICEIYSCGYALTLVWIPSHKGIDGNERADRIAKEAVCNGFRCQFKVPYTDFLYAIKERMYKSYISFMDGSFRNKGIKYAQNYYNHKRKPWFSESGLSRSEIVLINHIRSNHYNLNHSLFRKGYTRSGACPCGDPCQDVNHVIFYCPLTRAKAVNLFKYFKTKFPLSPIDIFPLLTDPPVKLCRLLLAFFKSINVDL